MSKYQRYDAVRVNDKLRRITREFDGVFFINLLPYFYPNGHCPALYDGKNLHYMDAAHTSPEFARYMAGEIERMEPNPVSALRGLVQGDDPPEAVTVTDTATDELESGLEGLYLRLECAP